MDDFVAFFDDNYEPVLRAVTVAIRDRARAEDCVQEAFTRAYVRWRSVSAMDRPVTWVYVVALNAQRREWRKAERRSESDDMARDAESVDVAASVVTTVTVRDAVSQLASRQRAAIVLRYLADLSVAEIAEVMGCAQGTVKATLHTALRSLRVDLEGGEL